MSWNGSGTFSRTDGTYSGSDTWEQNRDNGVKITVAAHDGHDQDLATGINACLTKNGENSPSAHLTWVKSAFWGGTSGGTANAQTITLSPAATAYAAGMEIKFIPGNTNTGGTTLNVNSIGAKTLKCFNGDALIGGELAAGSVVQAIYDGTDFLLTSFEPIWTSWTPTYSTQAGSISGTPTTTVASFKHYGDKLEFVVAASSIQQITSTSNYIRFTLPKAAANLGTGQIVHGYNGTNTQLSAAFVANNSTSVDVYADVSLSSGGWSIATHDLICNGLVYV